MENELKLSDLKTKKRSMEEKKNLIIRLNKIEGQIGGIKKMIENDRYCNDIIIQLSAIEKSISSLSNVILENHMHTCLVKDIQAGNLKGIDEMIDLFKKLK